MGKLVGPLRIGTWAMMVLSGLKLVAMSRVVGTVAIFYAKDRMSAKPLSVKRLTIFWSRRLNGITTPCSPFCLEKHFRVFQFSPFGVQKSFRSFLISFLGLGHNVGEVEGI